MGSTTRINPKEKLAELKKNLEEHHKQFGNPYEDQEQLAKDIKEIKKKITKLEQENPSLLVSANKPPKFPAKKRPSKKR